MTTPERPKRVIVVDADNPMIEVNGEFFWREDHELLLAAARDDAYRAGADSGYQAGYQEGYRAGWAAAAGPPATPQGVHRHIVELRKRRSLLGWLIHAAINLIVLWSVLMLIAFLAERHLGG